MLAEAASAADFFCSCVSCAAVSQPRRKWNMSQASPSEARMTSRSKSRIGILEEKDVQAMLDRTRAGHILDGFRGPALDKQAVKIGRAHV